MDVRRFGAVHVAGEGSLDRRARGAGLDLGLGATADSDGRAIPVLTVSASEDGGLTLHQGGGDLEEALGHGAPGQGGPGKGDLLGVGRQVAEHEPDLAGVDEARLEARIDELVPVRAVVAGEGGVFDHRHRCVGAADAPVCRRNRGERLTRPGGIRP